MKRAEHIRENAGFLRYDFPGAKVCFFGHSHHQLAFEVDESNVVRALPVSRKIFLERQNIHFINPGSVDAQRKSEHKMAECAIFDTADWSIEFLRVAYDAASTEAKAAVFGYRINRFTDRWYSLRRRLSRLAQQESTAPSTPPTPDVDSAQRTDKPKADTPAAKQSPQ